MFRPHLLGWLIFLVLGLAPLSLAGPLAPGFQKDLPTADPRLFYDLYLPKSYTPTSALAVAVILPGLATESSDWVKERMASWAERNNAAVFVMATKGVIDKAMSRADQHWYVRAYLAALDKIPGLHPQVRAGTSVEVSTLFLSSGLSVVEAFPLQVPGVVILGTLSDPPLNLRPPSYLAIAELRPTRAAWARHDPWPTESFGFIACDALQMPEFHRSWDRILKPSSHPHAFFEWGFEGKFDLDLVDDMLEYLVDCLWLTHPGVTPAQRQLALNAISARCAAAEAESDPGSRYRTAQVLSRVPGLTPALQKQVLSLWQAAAVNAIDLQPDDLSRYEMIMSLISDPRMKGAKTELPTIKKKLDALEADQKLKDEVAAHSTEQQILWLTYIGGMARGAPVAAGAASGLTPAVLNAKKISPEEGTRLLKQLIERYPGTFGAKEAEHRLAELAKQPQRPGKNG
jgi:hypothetical protein